MTAEGDTMRPFGRAILGKATYYVWPWWVHGAISIGFQVLGIALHALTLTSSLAFASGIVSLRADAEWASTSLSNVDRGVATEASAQEIPIWEFTMLAVPAFLLVQNAATLFSIMVVVAVKWAVIGRRVPGDYDWDTASYCQRWQVVIAAGAAFLGHGSKGTDSGLMDHMRGSAYVTWYLRGLGAQIGRDVCMHPTGADPFMTEPELVAVGDGACVDDAALTAHLNTAGSFSLGRVEVGARATLRRASRVLAGASVGAGAVLLEHTLALPGDTVDAAAVWQGWPAAVVSAPRRG